MKISYLELKNYRKFRDLKLQLPDGVIGILGLNGAGKTTIIEAVAWSLFGNVEEVVRTNRESLRRLGASRSDKVSVVLEFDLDGTEYRLEREMGGKNLSMKALLRSRGNIIAEGDRAVKSKVQDLIGMDHKSFFTSVFARQKELNELQNFAPAERKKVVLRMLRIDGVDSVIQAVREHRRDASERIKGAETVLLDPEGNDREKAVQARLKEVSKSLEITEKELKRANETEHQLVLKLEDTRKRRDGLKKDVDEHNSVSAELRAKRSAIGEQKTSEQGLVRKIEETERCLSRMPELKNAEVEWQKAVKAKETIEREKSRHEKREHLQREIQVIKEDIEAIRKEAPKLEACRLHEKEAQLEIESAKKDRTESDAEKNQLTTRSAELTARISEKNASLSKDRKKLADIEKAGEEGICPTCERALEDTYDLIVTKLHRGTTEAEEAISKDEKAVAETMSCLTAQNNRMKALEKKVQHQEEELASARRTIASITARIAELERLEKRLADRTREIEGLGEIRYSAKEHEAVKTSTERLRKAHDEFIQLGERQKQLATMKDDLGSLRTAMLKNEQDGKKLEIRVTILEPKRRLYDDSIREFDESFDVLTSAKDSTNRLKITLDRSKAESESGERDLDLIREQKKTIASEKAKVDELGSLEETLVNFKDHLIGKVAPALGEMTSEILGLMTEGKYERIELDDDYQISVDDGGALHPIDRFSGGEADLANLSLRLAISRIIADRAGTSQMNFLILDEIFGSLDPSRMRSVMAALSGLSSQFRQVMLITHVEEIKDLMMTVVRVEELPDGSSTAKIVS